MQKLVDNVNLVSREILTGLSVIRAFGREKKEDPPPAITITQPMPAPVPTTFIIPPTPRIGAYRIILSIITVTI